MSWVFLYSTLKASEGRYLLRYVSNFLLASSNLLTNYKQEIAATKGHWASGIPARTNLGTGYILLEGRDQSLPVYCWSIRSGMLRSMNVICTWCTTNLNLRVIYKAANNANFYLSAAYESRFDQAREHLSRNIGAQQHRDNAYSAKWVSVQSWTSGPGV